MREGLKQKNVRENYLKCERKSGQEKERVKHKKERER
jgi:hypothetical protein